MASQGGIEAKKKEFMQYLEKTGAADQLTEILVRLYEEPERPGNSVEYIRKVLGSEGDLNAGKLKKEFEAAKEENERLKRQIEETKEQIQKRKRM